MGEGATDVPISVIGVVILTLVVHQTIVIVWVWVVLYRAYIADVWGEVLTNR